MVWSRRLRFVATSAHGGGRQAAFCLAVALVLELRWLDGLPLCALVTQAPDDSFFYLRVAQWFWPAGEFTFDGVNPTYGYQPLWQLVLCALAPLLPDRRLQPGNLPATATAPAELRATRGYRRFLP